MQLVIADRQRAHKVDSRTVEAFAHSVFRALDIESESLFEISFVGPRRMRTMNKQLLDHDWVTDVISLRYPAMCGGVRQVAGELLIAPAEAARYAAAHGGDYGTELLRYVAHGILHWNGMEDATEAQRRGMRDEEDRLLAAFENAGTK